MTFTKSLKAKASYLNKNAKKLSDTILECGKSIINSMEFGGKIITFGNGGSASDAQHLVCELVGRFNKNRDALPAICLNTNVSNITSIGNDYGYNKVFSRQIEALCDPIDIVIGFSTSGNSANIINAIKKANTIGALTISFTGKDGGKLADLSDININIDLLDTPSIQEIHIILVHLLCDYIETEMSK